MARSSSIYVVFELQRIIAAFTVKHELVSFVKTIPSSSPDLYHVMQLRDGVGGGRYNDLTTMPAKLSKPVELPIEELAG
jgi:hypothetical protein